MRVCPGWFIDIEAATSLSAIAAYAPASLTDRGITEVSVAELRGRARELGCQKHAFA